MLPKILNTRPAPFKNVSDGVLIAKILIYDNTICFIKKTFILTTEEAGNEYQEAGRSGSRPWFFATLSKNTLTFLWLSTIQ